MATFLPMEPDVLFDSLPGRVLSRQLNGLLNDCKSEPEFRAEFDFECTETMPIFTLRATLSQTNGIRRPSLDHTNLIRSKFARIVANFLLTKRPMALFLSIAAIFSLCTSRTCPAQEATLTRYEFKQYHMGVDVRIVVYTTRKSDAEAAASAAYDRFAELDSMMSDYRPDSELMRLCDHAGSAPVRVSPDLFKVLQRSQEVARLSEGGFDVTCGPLVRLWRTARKTQKLPDPEAVAKVRTLVGWQKMELDARAHTVHLLVQGMKLDLGAIGKGYGADAALQVLKKHGIRRALVEAGGEVVVGDAPPGEKGWKVEVESAGKDGEKDPVLLFTNAAISTSGDSEQFVEIAGKRYSHVLDPRTAQPLTDGVQVTVVARDGMTSDSLATAVSVVGKEKGLAITKHYPGTTTYFRIRHTAPKAD